MTRRRRDRPRRAARSSGGDRLASRTLAALKWALLTSGGQALLSLGIVAALARLLTPQHFGQFAIALVFLALADTVGRRGLGPALVQRFGLTERHLATGFALSVAIGAALAAALWALAPPLAALVGEPAVAPILRTLSPATILAGLGAVSEHRLKRDLRFRPLMAAAILSQGIGGGLVAIALALLDHGVWSLVWGTLARHAVFALVVFACRPPPARPRPGGREAAQLLHTGVGFSAVALLNVAANHGVRLVVASALGAAALGLYTRASALALAPARLGPVLSNVLLPAMARCQRRVERLRAAHLDAVEMLSLAVLPAGLMVAASAPALVAAVLGGQWDGAVPALRVLALVGVLHTCDALQASVVRAMGAVYRETWRRALCLVLLLGGAWVASRWGLVAVAAAVAAARVVQHVLLAHLALSLLGVPWSALLRRHVPGLWAALWATPALWLALETLAGASWPAFAALALPLAAWGAAAVAAAYFAPPFARPAFLRRALARLPHGDMGRPGRWVRAALVHLARRWPASRRAGAP